MEEEVSEHSSSESENEQMSESSYESDDHEDEDEEETPKVDRISGLPDSIIHHILSFLPTSEDAVNTELLSKRWNCLWTRVPNLIFTNYSYDNMEEFFNFIDKTLVLHSSPVIKKFALNLDPSLRHEEDFVMAHPLHSSFDSRVALWVRFAIRHDVEELCLEFFAPQEGDKDNVERNQSKELFYYVFPQYFYNNSKLIKLKSRFCDYRPKGKVCWNSLKSLSITYAEFSDDDVVNAILQGSPVLECFELHMCSGVNYLDITSKSLKKFVINGIWNLSAEDNVSMTEISAPNLHSLEILGHWNWRKCRLINVSSLVYATLNFELTVDEEESNDFYGEYRNMLKELLDKVDHVKQLTLGTWCIQLLSISEMKVLPSPMSNRKCLILDMHFDEWDLPGLASLLHSSPKLEKLVIDMTSREHRKFDMHPTLYNSYNFGENYWTSKKWIFKCLLLHLRTIEIVGLKATSCGSEHLFAFFKFLLGNAKVLEKMVITDNYDGYQRRHNLYGVAQKLISFSRSSPRAVILLPKMM